MDIELGRARKTFIAEARELLHEMETALLYIERSPEDSDAINSLFRSIHTIKGSSGIVEVTSVEKFSHVAESLLSKVRDKEIKINDRIIELLLLCRDHIATLVDLAEAEVSDVPTDILKKGDSLTAALNSYLGGGGGGAGGAKPQTVTPSPQRGEMGNGCKDMPRHVFTGEGGQEAGRLSSSDAWHISVRFGRDVLKSGMEPLSFINYLKRLGEIISLTALFEKMPGIKEMDPEACYLGVEIDLKSDHDKKTIEDVFEFVREDSIIHILPPHSRVDSYIDLIKHLHEDSTLLGEILVRGGALAEGELAEALKTQGAEAAGVEAAAIEPHRLGEILVDSGMVQHEIVDAALEKQKEVLKVKSKEASTLRVDAGKLDSLVTMVGELVIATANLNSHVARLGDEGLVESSSVLQRLVEDVRDSSMKLRMVPIGETFSRFNRVVRDISRDFGKEIELEISGAETELDKTVIEKINDPLMHLVRNSADHGIERPQKRLEAGKSPVGTIRLNAYHDAGSIVIEIADDGRGLNRAKIMDKAAKSGLISAGENLPDEEMFGLIFEPGFSTAEEVTKLSGRGVGMDVVKRNIESLRGSVSVESAEGAGTTVRIRLPLTLAIIDGFMVRVNESVYIIPLEMVVECVDLPPEEKREGNRKSYINLRGAVLPYVHIRDFFGEGGLPPDVESIVIVQYGGQKIGLVVDRLYGEVQTVIKSLGKIYKDVKGISGATIMGDGTVALILDVQRLVKHAEEEEAETL